MPTQQPKWRFVANLGDRNPLDGGLLLYVDATGVYDPELVVIDQTQDERKYRVSRVSCPRHTMLANNPATLSDNPYHADKPAWYADKLARVADSHGIDVGDLAQWLVSCRPEYRARGMAELVRYFGTDEFDQYPRTMTAGEIRRQYRAAFRNR